MDEQYVIQRVGRKHTQTSLTVCTVQSIDMRLLPPHLHMRLQCRVDTCCPPVPCLPPPCPSPPLSPPTEDAPAAAEGATLEAILSDGFITDLIGVAPGLPNSAPGSGVTSPRTSAGGAAAAAAGPQASPSRVVGAAPPASSPGGVFAGATGASTYSRGAGAGPTGGSYFGSPAAAGPTGPPTPEPGAPLVPGRPAPAPVAPGVTPQVTGGAPPAPVSAAEAFGITGQGAAPASQLPSQGEGGALVGANRLAAVGVVLLMVTWGSMCGAFAVPLSMCAVQHSPPPCISCTTL